VFSSQCLSRIKVRREETTEDLYEVIPAKFNPIYLPIAVAHRLA